MSIIGSYRLVNALENGAYTSGTLETALATAKTKAEFKAICRDRQLLKRMLSNDVSATAVVNSATAINILLSGDAKVLQNILPDCYEFLLVICESVTGFSSLLAVPGMVSRLQNSPMALGVINASTVAFTRFPHKLRVVPQYNGSNAIAMVYSPTYGTTVLATALGISVRNKGQDYFTNITLPSAFVPASLAVNTTGTIIVAVGYHGGAANFVYTSVDGGLTWTSQAAGTNGQMYKVIYEPTNAIFVAIGITNIAGTNATIMTSSTGTSWSNQTSNTGGGGSLQDIVYGDGLFVAVGTASGTNFITTSPTGTTWTSRTHNISTFGTPLISGVTWGGTGTNTYVVVCAVASGGVSNNTTVCTSNTGTPWTASLIGGGIEGFSSITKTSNGYIATVNAVYSGGLSNVNNAYFSTSGTGSWTSYTVSGTATQSRLTTTGKGLTFNYSTNAATPGGDTINAISTANNVISWEPFYNYDGTTFTGASGTTKVFILNSGIYISNNGNLYTSN